MDAARDLRQHAPMRLHAAIGLLAIALTGCASLDCGPEIDGELPAPSLRETALWSENHAQAERLVAERRAHPEQDLWLAVVPGTSEQWGHHRAPPAADDPDGTRISDEFRARLDMAWLFLAHGTVRFVLVSGGAVDPDRPDYVEATRGRAYFLGTYGAAWVGEGALADHLLVDPLAEHSTTNLRNADKLSVDLGLNRNLIVTTLPARSGLSASGLTTQCYYFLEHGTSTFDAACRRDFGYTLGDFTAESTRDAQGNYLEGIRHCGFPVELLRADDYGP